MSAARKLAYLTADDIADRKSCLNCIHLDHELIVEDAQDERQNWMRYECTARPQISNLRAFPFGMTKCKRYQEPESTP